MRERRVPQEIWFILRPSSSEIILSDRLRRPPAAPDLITFKEILTANKLYEPPSNCRIVVNNEIVIKNSFISFTAYVEHVDSMNHYLFS